MDFIDKEQARRDIVALGLPQIVLDIIDAKPLPDNLDITFRAPHTILELTQEQQARYGQGRITPLWTGGGDYTVVAYHHDPTRQEFFRFDIETAEEQQPIGMNWQQILVEEFKTLWETDLLSSARLIEISGWFDFKYIESLIDELSHSKLDTFEKSEAWYQSFLQKLAAP